MYLAKFLSPDCNVFNCIAVPGELYHLKNDTPSAPIPSPSVDNFSGMDQHLMKEKEKSF